MARNKHPEETIRKILAAALKLFMEKGFEETTVLDIVAQLGGLTRGAFYYHFKTKEDVLDALSDQIYYEDNIFDKLKTRNDLNGLEKLKAIMNPSRMSKEEEVVGIAAVSLLTNSRILAEVIKSNNEVLVPRVAELIEEGIEDGSIPNIDPKAVADLLVLLGNFWLFPSIFPSSSDELKAKINLLKKIFDGLGIYLFDDEVMKGLGTMIEDLV